MKEVYEKNFRSLSLPDLGGLELYMKNLTKYLNSTAVINKKIKTKKIY